MFRRLVIAITLGCAPTQSSRTGAPPPAAERPVTAQDLVERGKKEMSLAEAALDQLEAEKAAQHLDAAKKAIYDAKVDSHDEAMIVRARHQELSERLPAVRAEARKIGVARAKEKIEAARANVDAAIAGIKRRNVSIEELDAARAAVEALGAALDEGSQYELGDLAYTKFSLDARRAYRMRRDLVEKRWLTVSVERQRGRVEDGRRAIADALREGHLEEAEQHIAATRKVLEEGQELAKKDREYRSYALQVNLRLKEAQQKVDSRRLWIAIAQQKEQVKEALASMKESLARLPAPEDVDAAEQYIDALEKTVAAGEALAAKDPPYARYALEAKKAAADGRKRLALRRDELAMEAQQVKVEAALEMVKVHVSALDGIAANDQAFAAAASAAEEAKKAIASGVELEKKLPKYASWANGARRTLEDATKRIEKSKLEVEIAAQKGSIEELIEMAKTGVENAKDQDASSKEIATAAASLKAVRDGLAKGTKLEGRDSRYASFANSTRKQIDRLEAELGEAKSVVAFREGPIAAMIQGLNAAEKVSSSMGLEAQRKAYEQALSKLEACERDSASMVEENPRLGSMDFYLIGDRTKGKNVAPACSAHAESIAAKLSEVKARISFWDGPAKSFETGRANLAKGDKSGALSSFESCLETGKILQHKHPALAKEQFEVAGQKRTLPAIVSECHKEARALRGTITTAKK